MHCLKIILKKNISHLVFFIGRGYILHEDRQNGYGSVPFDA